MTMRDIVQGYINKLAALGYKLSSDAEGNITVSDDKHGVIYLRIMNIGDEVRFDFSKNANASNEFEQTVLDIFIDVLNK